jgi:RNA polymerase I-specific transcription initiation factor RRN7
VEVYVYAEKLVSLLRLEFSYSTTASPPFSNPDSLLAMSLVLAVKILYPFASREQESATVGEQPSHGGRHLDWAAWAAIYQSQYSRRKPVPDYDKTTSAEVYDMTSEDMDSYLDWYEETQITVEQGMRRYLDLIVEQQLTKRQTHET